MSSFQEGYQWTSIGTGVGTNVISDRHSKLYGVVIPGTYTGTIAFHDSATAAGTTGSTKIVTFGLPLLNTPRFVEISANCQKGITYEATGTPVMTALWN